MLGCQAGKASITLKQQKRAFIVMLTHPRDSTRRISLSLGSFSMPLISDVIYICAITLDEEVFGPESGDIIIGDRFEIF